MERTYRAVKPLLCVDVGCRRPDGPSGGEQLVVDSVQADGVVIRDVAMAVGTEDGAQVHTRGQLAEGGAGFRGPALAAAAMAMTMVLFRTEVSDPESAAAGFAAQVDGEFIGQCCDEVG